MNTAEVEIRTSALSGEVTGSTLNPDTSSPRNSTMFSSPKRNKDSRMSDYTMRVLYKKKRYVKKHSNKPNSVGLKKKINKSNEKLLRKKASQRKPPHLNEGEGIKRKQDKRSCE